MSQNHPGHTDWQNYVTLVPFSLEGCKVLYLGCHCLLVSSLQSLNHFIFPVSPAIIAASVTTSITSVLRLATSTLPTTSFQNNRTVTFQVSLIAIPSICILNMLSRWSGIRISLKSVTSSRLEQLSIHLCPSRCLASIKYITCLRQIGFLLGEFFTFFGPRLSHPLHLLQF